MTQDEIIEIAREIGLCRTQFNFNDWIDAGPSTLELVELAKLVEAKATAKEREKLKNVALFDRWYQELDAAVLAEREACANLCDELGEKGYVAEGCSKAIRARGEA